MIEINHDEAPGVALVRLMRQLADARRAAHANAQALEDCRAELSGQTAELERLRVLERREAAPETTRWNNAIDWLLNSRHTADPDIQGPFWKHVDGEISLEELRES